MNKQHWFEQHWFEQHWFKTTRWGVVAGLGTIGFGLAANLSPADAQVVQYGPSTYVVPGGLGSVYYGAPTANSITITPNGVSFSTTVLHPYSGYYPGGYYPGGYTAYPPGYGVIGGQQPARIQRSVLVNPTIINSQIRNSTLINPTIVAPPLPNTEPVHAIPLNPPASGGTITFPPTYIYPPQYPTTVIRL